MHFTSTLLSTVLALGAAAASTSSSSLIQLPATTQSSSSSTIPQISTVAVFNPLLPGYAAPFPASVISTSAGNFVAAVVCAYGNITNGCIANQTATITYGSTFAETFTAPGTGIISVSCNLTSRTAGFCSSYVTSTVEGTVMTTSGGRSLTAIDWATGLQDITITAGPNIYASSTSSTNAAAAAATMGPIAVAGMAVPAGIALLAAAL